MIYYFVTMSIFLALLLFLIVDSWTEIRLLKSLKHTLKTEQELMELIRNWRSKLPPASPILSSQLKTVLHRLTASSKSLLRQLGLGDLIERKAMKAPKTISKRQ